MNQAKKQRNIDSISSCSGEISSSNTHRILLSPADMGVRRNLGRNGSRYAPECIVSQLQKLQKGDLSIDLAVASVTNQQQEIDNYSESIKSETKQIEKLLKDCNLTIHLGGGHDHAYPMLMALDSVKSPKIHILNVDAHCDTRVSDEPHSGTPFRDYDSNGKSQYDIHQYGIHPFANSESTMGELKRGKSKIHFYNDVKDSTSGFSNVTDFMNEEVSDDDILYFSLDADALHSSFMEGVSAVNHQGLPLDHTIELMQHFFSKNVSCRKVLGIYEYNPIFDNLSNKGSRALAALIFEFLK